MERRAAREIKRQQVATEATAKAAADQDGADHEVAMAAHIGQKVMVTSLAAGATNEEAIAARMVAHTAAMGAGDTMNMQD